MFENLIAALKADKRKIVFTEGPDARILEAAARLKKWKSGEKKIIIHGMNVRTAKLCRKCPMRFMQISFIPVGLLSAKLKIHLPR